MLQVHNEDLLQTVTNKEPVVLVEFHLSHERDVFCHEKHWVMHLVLLVIQLVYELHNVVFRQFADPDLLRAIVIGVLRHDQRKVSSVLGELHEGNVNTF